MRISAKNRKRKQQLIYKCSQNKKKTIQKRENVKTTNNKNIQKPNEIHTA